VIILVKAKKPDKIVVGTDIDSVVLPKSNIGYKSIDQLSSDDLQSKIDGCELDLYNYLNAPEYPPAACRLVKCSGCMKICNESMWSKCGINLNVFSNEPLVPKMEVFIVPKFHLLASEKADEVR
jgi:hypothetical protein